MICSIVEHVGPTPKPRDVLLRKWILIGSPGERCDPAPAKRLARLVEVLGGVVLLEIPSRLGSLAKQQAVQSSTVSEIGVHRFFLHSLLARRRDGLRPCPFIGSECG